MTFLKTEDDHKMIADNRESILGPKTKKFVIVFTLVYHQEIRA